MNTKTTTPRPRGRPRSASPREIVWPFRFSKDEAKTISKKAKKSGKPRGEWIREVLMAA